MKPTMIGALCAGLLSASSPAVAADEEQFIFDNLTGTFYHELAHALVDQLDLPIYGQEEDAADVLAAYLITEWHEGEEVRRLTRHVALTFFSDFFVDERSGREVVWDGVHGPSKQRMYNHLCVAIGSDPDALSDIGTTFEMEKDRLKDCDTEYDAARFSWGAVIDDLIDEQGEGKLVVTGLDSYMKRSVGQWAQAEIERINSVITFPNDIPVAIIKCGQFNAFYDTKRKEIQMCMEQNRAHRRQFKQFGDRFPIN